MTTHAQHVNRMGEDLLDQFSGLDIAVNNAGVFRSGDDADQTLDDWNAVIDINLAGAWLCSNVFRRCMQVGTRRRGSVINIASLAATRAISTAAYDASKAGLVQMSASLARQWGSLGVRVNALSPGYVGEVFGSGRSEAELDRLVATTPVGRVMQVEDLVGPLLFLASDASGYVTGQNIVIDGGHGLSTWLPETSSTALRR